MKADFFGKIELNPYSQNFRPEIPLIRSLVIQKTKLSRQRLNEEQVIEIIKKETEMIQPQS
jgi:hypothetical protein